MARVVQEHSAGGVTLVPVGRETFVALIEVQGHSVLALPKGHIEKGETSEGAAVREVREETGISTALLAPLGDIDYTFYSRRQRTRVRKRVDFYLLEYRSGSPWYFNEEADAVRLVRLSEVLHAVSYPGEREIIRRALTEIRQGIGRPQPVPA